jgi:hypothetical protein
MSSPVTCSCDPFDCGLQKISVGISVKQVRTRTQKCGFNNVNFLFPNFPNFEEPIDPEKCGCSGVDWQGVYDTQKNTKEQIRQTFNGVTATTTKPYGEPQIFNPNQHSGATWHVLSRCAFQTTETAGTPIYECDENGNGTFLDTDNPISCEGFSVSANESETTAAYVTSECGGDDYNLVNLTGTTELAGGIVDIKAKSIEIINLVSFPTNYIGSSFANPPISRVIFEYTCPIFEFGDGLNGCNPTVTKSQGAVDLVQIDRSKTLYAINFKLPETCYVKIWYAKWSTKEKALNLASSPDEFWYGNAELISGLSIQSLVADLPQVNGTCISENNAPEFIRIISEQGGLSGELSTLDFEDLGPNEDCCTNETPDDQNYCRYSLTKRVGVIGWSIISDYTPTFYNVTWDPLLDQAPDLGYYGVQISSSLVVYSPFNDYAPTQQEQDNFDAALAAYNSSRASSAP